MQYGDEIAVTDSEKKITYLELNQKAICIGQYFMEKGICKDDKVLVQMPNRISFVAVLFALAKIRTVPIMMLPAHREAELEGIIALAKPTAYVVAERYLGFSYVEMAMNMQKKFPCIQNVFVDGVQREEWYEPETEGQGEFPEVDSYSTAVLLLPGGTTGVPKLIPRAHTDYMYNETERSIPFKCLHEAFFECAYRFPDKTALEWLSLDEKWETLSYEALKIKVLQTASMLKQEGVHTRDKVAIVLPKGENQIIAVLAILSIGATYVPIGIHQPLDRKKKIFEAGNISYALTDRDHINTLDGADTLRSFLIENSFRYVVMPETEIVKDIDSIAYIIFTSGTTGIPKGVMITHKAAYNTIYDVNDKFTINEHDCAIAVSELDFDLSVYDIFGMLGYGASLIVLNEMNKREPYIWKKILCEKRVTIWNSVPALFEMFLLAIGYDYEKVTLKNILLSGDWIKLEIYPKVNKLWPECRFVSLGGATEAAIWSVYYEVHILDEPWTSIPYGRPLANQLLRVVNNKGKDSPVGVPGELWIGGYGVAEGYVNEEKLTQERFVKIDGIRWYKTGDKAQYFQDGNVQFLGRLDDQVKVNGYRIELGEIENVIKRAECIDDAIAMTVETNGKKEIVAAVVEKYEKGNASHQVFMNEENPEYAEIQEIRKKVVAAFILKVYGNNVDSLTPNDNIVINSNGKVEQYWNVWLLINNVISHKENRSRSRFG